MEAEKLKILQLHFTISNHVITVAKNLVLMVNIFMKKNAVKYSERNGHEPSVF